MISRIILVFIWNWLAVPYGILLTLSQIVDNFPFTWYTFFMTIILINLFKGNFNLIFSIKYIDNKE